MKTSKYLERFSSLPKDAFKLIGDHLIVERLELEERKTAGGIIINHGITPSTHKNSTQADLPVFVVVVSVGEGYYNDETGEPVDLTIQAGDICLVGSHSVRWFSDMEIKDYQPYELGLTREAEIKWVFKGKSGYEAALEHLNSFIKKEV